MGWVADRGPSHDDESLARAVARVLATRLGGGHQWGAHARDGHVVVCHRHGDPVELHLASMIAGSILGVLSVDPVPRRSCPYH